MAGFEIAISCEHLKLPFVFGLLSAVESPTMLQLTLYRTASTLDV
jgi:hypothetical protein